jgi:hypothetical protein
MTRCHTSFEGTTTDCVETLTVDIEQQLTLAHTGIRRAEAQRNLDKREAPLPI